MWQKNGGAGKEGAVVRVLGIVPGANMGGDLGGSATTAGYVDALIEKL